MARFDTFDTVVFDLDGTLLDTLPDLVVLTNTALGEFGFPHRSTDEIRSFVGDGARALICRAVPKDTPAHWIEAVMQRWEDLYSTVGNKLTRPYPYIEKTLIELKGRGIYLGVLSNKFDQGAHDAIDEYLPGLFSVVHGERDGIPRKPDPAGLLSTIDELGSVPEKTIYVGDSPGDIKTARNAGTFALGAAWGYHGAAHLSEAHADAVIEDARGILEFI